MKLLKYNIRNVCVTVDEEGNQVEHESFLEKYAPDNEDGWAIAEQEAYGEIIPFDDGQPEYVAEPTIDEILNALLGVNRYA